MADNMEFLEAMHGLSETAKKNINFLDLLIDNPTTSLEVASRFREIRQLILTQDLVIRRLCEEQFFIQDQLTELGDRIETRIQDSQKEQGS